ncbi:hypothetical protein BGZ82_007141 [Podila clonocystis]|nr:hypothetical protein BGZ82_007141 [Podila clonocystis]
MPEDVQALFDLPWNCPLLERIELVGFKPSDDMTDDDDHSNEDGYEAQSEGSAASATGLESSMGDLECWDEEDSFSEPSTNHSEEHAEPSHYEPRPRVHTETTSDHDFLDMLERHGWEDRFSEDTAQTVTRAQRALRDRLFERFADLPA